MIWGCWCGSRDSWPLVELVTPARPAAQCPFLASCEHGCSTFLSFPHGCTFLLTWSVNRHQPLKLPNPVYCPVSSPPLCSSPPLLSSPPVLSSPLLACESTPYTRRHYRIQLVYSILHYCKHIHAVHRQYFCNNLSRNGKEAGLYNTYSTLAGRPCRSLTVRSPFLMNPSISNQWCSSAACVGLKDEKDRKIDNI